MPILLITEYNRIVKCQQGLPRTLFAAEYSLIDSFQVFVVS